MRSPAFYAGISVVTSLVTIALKFGSYAVTGSVGLLSDAIEGFVNVAAEHERPARRDIGGQGHDDP